MKVKAIWGNYSLTVTLCFMSDDVWQVSYVYGSFYSKQDAIKVAERLATHPTKEERKAIEEGRVIYLSQ